VTPGLAGDTLSLQQTGGNGTLALQSVGGVEEVIYTAPPAIAASAQDAVSYTISDQHNDAMATGSASVQLDAGPSITAVTPSVVEKNQSTEIGTVTPGLAGDTLSLQQTGGNGTLALQLVGGVEEVIYTAPPTIATSTPDTVSYTISDQHNDAMAAGSASVQLDAGPSITAVTPSVVENGQTTEIGIVTPGLAGDLLTLQQTSGNGTLALQLVSGVEEVIYTAPSTIASILDTVSYTISDQHMDAVATGSNTVPFAPAGDTIYVGTAGGSISVRNGNSAIDGRAGNETITVGNGADVIFGGPNDAITAGNGTDTIYSGANSSITAGNGNDAVTAGANSSVQLGNGNDAVTAGPNSSIKLGNGNDTVTAGDNSSVKLGNGNDTVTAGANSTITVGNGNDHIFAGANDLINIGRGSDTVAFGESPNPIAIGNETINGFNPAQDILQFNPALLSSYSAADITQVGANTVIQIDPANSVTLDNVKAAALSASNFHFS
jgi:Ca2+-binding RTX toxin-like protein